MKKLFVISTSRSDYGCLKYVIDELENENVNYAHLNYQFVQNLTNEKAMKKIISVFNNDIIERNIKNIFILGDRWETLLIALIAKYNNINIFHQGGGEVSDGSYDNDFRKAISQLSDYHFVINENCLKRLNDQGIKNNIYICGSPRLDNDKKKVKKLKFKNKTGLVIYHPVTKNNKAQKEIETLIDSLKYFDMNYIIVYPNQDKESNVIIKKIKEFALIDGVKLFKRIKLQDYYDILNSVDVMIGNSSSGIIETASYNLPTVNIGDRQKNRDCNDNVIHCICEKNEIIKSIQIALSEDFKKICEQVVNKFGDGLSGKKIVNIIKGVL